VSGQRRIVECELRAQLTGKLERRLGRSGPVFCARAPGRVNLIGEHTDYNGGLVMPMAIDREVVVAFRPVSGRLVRVWSENYQEWDEFKLDRIEKNQEQPWANYVRGVALVLQQVGYEVAAIEGLIHGDVPIGAGLSSSAAIEVASALAFCAAAGLEPDRKELALLCQRAENEFVGVNCGIMDQFVSLHAEERHALLLDCRSLDYALLPLDTSVVKVLVCNTMVHHELGSSAYNERRATCERAARLLNERTGGVSQLRDVNSEVLAEYASALDEVAYRRARHVVTENERVLAAQERLRAGDYEGFGSLMNASHKSLRDDYEVSCAELDLMVELARRQPGTLGARLTGAGFGGCTVNLVRPDAVEAFKAAVAAGYRQATGIKPQIHEFSAAPRASAGRC